MHVLYCSAQLDGIAAAAILLRSARLRNNDAKIGGFLDFDSATAQFSAMETLSGDLIFVLDFLPDNLAALKPKLDAITVRNRIAYWNSHHGYSAQDAELLKRYAHTVDLSGPLHEGALPKEKKCAAELAQQRFLPNDRVAQELARMAHDIEFWERTHETAVKLADLLASGHDAKQLADALSRGAFWNDHYGQLHRDYLSRKKAALQDILSHLAIKNIAGTNFGFTLSPQFLSSADAGQHILDSHAGVDVSVVMYRNGRVSFRKRDACAHNLAELAKLFGGGGHTYAAGAKLAQFPSVTRDNFGSAMFLIDQQLRSRLIS
jgi:oligoribonuclease NrnB/cAMP/cGMP phosphodiesterase (DHH superfamily)